MAGSPQYLNSDFVFSDNFPKCNKTIFSMLHDILDQLNPEQKATSVNEIICISKSSIKQPGSRANAQHANLI